MNAIPDPRHALGQSGETAAAKFLAKQGIKIVERHFQTRWGEIDLIGLDRGTWVFIEVKTRAKAYAVAAVEAIHRAKQERILKAALSYMKRHRLEGQNMRFDAVLIEGSGLDWIPGAFDGPSRFTF